MARLWSCGFELQSVTANVEIDSVSGAAIAIETAANFRSGLAACKFNPTTTTTFFTRQYAASTNASHSYFIRAYIYVTSLPSANSTSFMLARGTTNGNLLDLRMNTDGTIKLTDEQNASVQVGSSSAAINLNQWYRVEFSYNFSTGAANAYLDGTNFATGTVTASKTNDSVRIGVIDTATMVYYVDDIAVNDETGAGQTGLPGDGKLMYLRPAAAGDAATGTRSGTDSGANWSQTNETTPDDATEYITMSGTLNNADMYKLTSATGTIGGADTISVIQVGARMRGSGSATSNALLKLQIEAIASGTKTQGATAFGGSASTWGTNNTSTVLKPYDLTSYTLPGTSTAWTLADINTAQIGWACTTAGTSLQLISTLWMIVDYSPSTATLLSLQVNASGNDAHQNGNATTATITDATFSVGTTNTTDNPPEIGAFRFTNVTIAQGSTIISAVLKLCSNGDFITCNGTWNGEAADNSSIFTVGENLNSRSRTTASLACSENISRTAGIFYPYPSNGSWTAIVQEIVNRGGWASGNAMSFFIRGTAASNFAHATIRAFDTLAADGATLAITYTPAAGGATTVVVYRLLLGVGQI